MLRDRSAALRDRKPTNEGFAGPGSGDSDPCPLLAGFRIRVCRFWAAWRTRTLDRLLGPGNGRNRDFNQNEVTASTPTSARACSG
jgi:hypothetical protein